MEIDQTKINKFNTSGCRHGYWSKNSYRIHYYNDQQMGLEIINHSANQWKCHYINDKEIGCEKLNRAQYFYNKSGKLFGEDITWK